MKDKKKYTLAELVERSVPYFASNEDVSALLATTDGKFYRPEFESYAKDAAEKTESEVVVVYREALLVPAESCFGEPLTEAGTLADVVANSATHLPGFFAEAPATPAEPAAPATPAEVKPKRAYTPRGTKATATAAATEKKAPTKKTK